MYSLRELNIGDADSIQDYMSDPEVCKFLPCGTNTKDETLLFLKNAVSCQNEENRKNYEFGIILNGKLIGNCSLRISDNDYEASIGYVVNKNYQNSGAATWAAGELLKIGFINCNLHRIYAVCTSDNIPSFRVMEKNNMRREAVFKSSYPVINGNTVNWKDEYLYAILREDFKIV